MSAAVVVRCQGYAVLETAGGRRVKMDRCRAEFTDGAAHSPAHAREHAEDCGWFATSTLDLCPSHRDQRAELSA